MERYEWRKPPNSPDRLELIDHATKVPIGEIVGIQRKWFWYRKTSVLLHGVPPAEGVSRQLSEAKERLLDGLPD
jgi:hypothetical protein